MVEKKLDHTKQDERADRILDAAAKLITHYGYDKTTVSDIAREAGVSKGAIYLHWKSKEDLFEALVMHESLRYVDDWLARVEADPDGGTYAGMFTNALIALKANPFMMAIINRDRRVLTQSLLNRNNSLITWKFEMGKEFLEMMQQVGIVREDIDVEASSYLMTIIRVGILKVDEVIPPEQAPPYDRVMEMMATMLNRLVAPEGGGDSEAGKAVMRQMAAASTKHLKSMLKK